MIKQWFSPPVKPTQAVVGQLPMVPGSNADTYGAKRLGLDLVEYRHRQVVIAKACREIAELGWKIGETLYPKDTQQWVKIGAVELQGIARTPNEYGHAEWDEHAPRILRCKLKDKQNAFIDCSVGYLTNKMPVQSEQQEC